MKNKVSKKGGGGARSFTYVFYCRMSDWSSQLLYCNEDFEDILEAIGKCTIDYCEHEVVSFNVMPRTTVIVTFTECQTQKAKSDAQTQTTTTRVTRSTQTQEFKSYRIQAGQIKRIRYHHLKSAPLLLKRHYLTTTLQ